MKYCPSQMHELTRGRSRTMFVFLVGCSGSPASLSGSDGTFGINKTYYLNDMGCAWKILVNSTQVKHKHFIISCILQLK